MIKPLFDDNGQIIIPTIVLCNRNKHKLGSIYPIKDFEITPDLYGNNEMTFKVYKYNNGVELSIWDKIIDLKLIYIPEYDEYFEIDVDDSETKENVKSVTAINLGVAELSQTNLYDIEINTEEDIARQDYQIAQFYDTLNPNTTILGRVMSKAPHYKINHVDMSLHNIVRQFSINDKDIYGFLTGDLSDEIHCLVKANSNRTIDVYDLYDYCLDCNERADEMNGECPVCHSKNIKNGYGQNTTTYISTENLASEISVETDKDSVKNTFRVQGGDDVINAAIRACNPNGTQYINRFSKETLDDMSNELKNGIVQYQEVYDSKVDEYKQCMNTLYDVLDKILYLESEMMPNPSTDVHTAQSELELLTHDNLSPISVQSLSSAGITTVDNAIKGMFPIYLHSGFSAEIIESKYETGSTTWEGRFRVTNKSIADDNDSNKYAETPMGVFIQIEINEDFENFIKQKLKRILEKESIVELQDIESDDDFKKELELYCKNILSSFSDAYQSCLEVLSGVNASEKNNEFYESLYMQYYRRKKYIDEEIIVREKQIIEQENLRDQQISIRDSIQSELNLETFLEKIKDGLYNEFCSYRREDTYQNDNYISDGLSNSELIQKAQELLDVAKKEIYKSSETQYAVTTTIGNLFANKDFSVLHDIFVPGNWVRINTDGKIFKLRLLNYTIRESSISELPCEFSNVTKISNGMTDIESILSSAKSMASSFESVKNQAKNASNINVPTKVSELNNDNNYLTIDSSIIANLQIGKLDVVELHAEVAKFGYLTADSAIIANLETNKLNTSDLNAENAKLGYLNATSAIITSLQTDKLDTKSLSAEVAKLGYLTANSAVITSLQTDKLNAKDLNAEVAKLGYLDAKMANIDFANLNKANIGQLFANVGLISSATITDGHVTGYLDSVEVNANKITAGTLAVDRLLIKDSSGNYKMATYDSSGNLVTTTVNGSVITNRTITADHLVAGTITANEINMTNLVGNSAFINAINTNSVVVSASNNASSALSTANTANSNASNALNTANSANTTANSASSTANSALSTANTANSNASSAISTANSASSKAQGIIDNIYTPNTTTINGGKITTGSIKAAQIDVNDLFAQNITASGTITGVTITSKKSGLTDGITITGGELISNEAETYITKLSSGSLYLQGVNGNTNIKSFILNQTDGTNTTSLASGMLTLNGTGYTSHLQPHILYIVDSGGSRSSITPTTIYENGTALSDKYAPISHGHDYLPLSGGTMTGNLINNNFLQTPYLTGEPEGTTWQRKKAHGIQLGIPYRDYLNFYEYGRVFNFYKTSDVYNKESGDGTLCGKITINGWEGNVVGNVTGNASSANYANSAGSAPASDVYSWAKQPTKPSYALNEITGSSDIFKVVTYSYNSVSVASGSSATVTPSRTNIPSGYTAVAVYTVNSGGGRIYPRAHSADGTIVLVNESSTTTVTPSMKVLCVKSICVG